MPLGLGPFPKECLSLEPEGLVSHEYKALKKERTN